MNTATDRRAGFDWRWLALSLSLVCNVFLAAVIAGHFLARRAGTIAVPAGGTPLARALERTQAILPAKDAATFRTVLERDKPRYARAAIQVALARRDLERAIAAQPFDPKAASQALATWRNSWSGFVDDLRCWHSVAGDAAESDVRGRAVDRLRLPCGRPIAAAVAGGTQM